MAQIKVADVSRWQYTINWDVLKTEVQAVVIKATGADGGLYTDGLFARNRDEARRVGLPRWFYHYKGAGSARQQAEYFVNAIGGLQPGEGLVLDDENEGRVNVAFCAEFADRVKELTGLNVVIYSNQARFGGVDLQPLKDRNLGAWVAKYGMNTGTVEGAGAAPSIATLSMIMWQYTSAARLASVTQNSVDMNIFYGSVEDFVAYGAKGNVPAPSVPAPAPAQQASGNGVYTVVSGDTLSGIGIKLGLNWGDIARWNGIVAPYTIYPSQQLKVYGGAAQATPNVQPAGTYTVVRGDTLSGIGAKTSKGWQDIANLNGIKSPYTIYPGQVLRLPGGGVAQNNGATYTVVSGDTLSGIGTKTGRRWQDIANLNGIGAPYTIYPNQVLRLP
jgi:LysM repeat protein